MPASQHPVFELNPPALCRAYKSAAQDNLTSGAWTKIALDAESYDPGSYFDTTNNRFVAPVAGYYQINVNLRLSSIVKNKRYGVGIRVGGVERGRSQIHSVAAQVLTIVCSDILQLAADDQVEMYGVSHAGASSVDVVVGEEETFMSIHLLSAA